MFSLVNLGSFTPGTGTSKVISVPSGVVDGDVLIAWLFHNDLTNPSAPAGWTRVANFSAGQYHSSAFTRVASGEPGSYTWTTTNAFTMGGGMAAYRANPPGLTLEPTLLGASVGESDSSLPNGISLPTQAFTDAGILTVVGNFGIVQKSTGGTPALGFSADADETDDGATSTYTDSITRATMHVTHNEDTSSPTPALTPLWTPVASPDFQAYQSLRVPVGVVTILSFDPADTGELYEKLTVSVHDLPYHIDTGLLRGLSRD